MAGMFFAFGRHSKLEGKYYVAVWIPFFTQLKLSTYTFLLKIKRFNILGT